MSSRGAQACRSFWAKRRLRLLVAVVAAAGLVVFFALGSSSVFASPACSPTGPTNTTAPSLTPSGNQLAPKTLTLTEGTWSPVCRPIQSYSYTWFRDGTQFLTVSGPPLSGPGRLRVLPSLRA